MSGGTLFTGGHYSLRHRFLMLPARLGMNSVIIISLSLQDEKRGVLKDVIPSVLISAAAHCGRHYWTSSTTRQQAHGQPVILYCANGSCNNHTIVM